jgi:hypothetical protein
MHRILLTALYLLISIPASPAGQSEIPPSLTSLNPVVSIDGGTQDARQTVLDAVDRFVTSGLALPELDVRIHHDNTGCNGKRGLFHENDGAGIVDLCFGGEFLALHELGHAWVQFNIDDDTRSAFIEMTGAETWRSSNVVWGHRGTELAAEAIAHGLLSLPLEPGQRTTELARFEFLTAMPSPREVAGATAPVAAAEQSDSDREATAAYAQWRSQSAAAASLAS